GGKPLVASWDRGAFLIDDPDTFPSVYGPALDTPIRHGWSLDWASGKPGFVVGVFNLGTDKGKSGYSLDGRRTWSAFAGAPAGVDCCSGAIAAASATNFVWAPSNNAVPYFTLDAGATWKAIEAPGAPTSGETGWGFAYYLDRRIVAADRVSPATF